jgi:uncharacterized protein YneF (UPF0154 family)
MTILYFILGGVWTIVMLAVGGIVGYFLGTKELEKSLERIRQHKKPIESGPVKQITPLEKQADKVKGESDRIKELMS